MPNSRIDGNLYTTGTVTCDQILIQGTTPIDASKLEHRHIAVWSNEVDTLPADGKYVIYVSRFAGVVKAIKAGLKAVPAGDDTT